MNLRLDPSIFSAKISRLTSLSAGGFSAHLRLVGAGLLTLLVVVPLLGLDSRCWAGTPTITKIDPLTASVDETIKLVGENLRKTRRVHFVVKHTSRPAKFTAASDTELRVIVPEFYRPNAEAVILLETDDGVVVTCPTNETVIQENQASAPGLSLQKTSFLHVIQGGVIQRSSWTTVIEKGGVVGRIDERCPLVLLKNGSTLVEVESHTSSFVTIFYEPAAAMGHSVFNPKHGKVLLFPVATIQLSEGIGPFLFSPPTLDPALPQPDSAPQIKGHSPARVAPGDILTLHGKGFSDTSTVGVVSHSIIPAGFRVISDTELRIELPEGTPSQYELIVINSQGLTLTQSPAVTQPVSGIPAGLKFIHIPDGKVVGGNDLSNIQGHVVLVVEKGGTLSNRHLPVMTFVRAGGTLVESVGTTYFEPGASVPPAVRVSQEVKSINIAKLQSPLRVIHPYEKP